MNSASLELAAGAGSLGALQHRGRGDSAAGTLPKWGGPPGSRRGLTPFLFLLQIAFIVKYYHLGGRRSRNSACSVYKMSPAECPEEYGVAAFEAVALILVFAKVVRRTGQQQTMLVAQASPRLMWLVFALLCADIANAVLVNGFYFVQVPVNFIGYLLLGCTAIFEVQHAVQLHESTLHFIVRGLISFSYYTVLLQVLFALSLLALNIGDNADNGVAAFVQVLAEIAVVVECLMMPSVESACSAATVHDMVRQQNVGESLNSNRRRWFLSVFLAVQFAANAVKFVLPSPPSPLSGDGGGRGSPFQPPGCCTIFKMTAASCPAMFWCSCLQLGALVVIFVFTLHSVGQEMLQKLGGMNGRLVFLCFGMGAVNVVYMVLSKNYAYAPQIVVDPFCYMLSGVLATVEVQHWRDDQSSMAPFLWRLGLNALFYIVLLTLLITMVRLSHDIKDAAIQTDGAYAAAFIHVMMEVVAATECLLLSFI